MLMLDCWHIGGKLQLVGAQLFFHAALLFVVIAVAHGGRAPLLFKRY